MTKEQGGMTRGEFFGLVGVSPLMRVVRLHGRNPRITLPEPEGKAEADFLAGPYGPEVSLQWRMKNPLDIVAMADEFDSYSTSSNVVRQNVVVKKKGEGYFLCMTESNRMTGTFHEYRIVSRFPFSSVSCLACSNNKIARVAGVKTEEGAPKLVIDYRDETNWKDIALSLSERPEDITNLISIGENNLEGSVFLITVTNPDGTDHLLLNVNTGGGGRSEKTKKVTWKFKGQIDFNPGFVRDLRVVSIDEENSEIELVSNASNSDIKRDPQYGILTYKLNRVTGVGTIENIETVDISGKKEKVNLGNLKAGYAYVDGKGYNHWLASTSSWSVNIDRRNVIYDVGLTSKTAVEVNYKEIDPSFCKIEAIVAHTDGQGKLHTIIKGFTWVDGEFWPALIDVERQKIIGLMPKAGIEKEGGLEIRMMNNQLGYIFNTGVCKGFLPTGSDTPIWIDGGLEN